MREDESFSLLRLSAIPGIGPNRIRILRTYFKSVSMVFAANADQLSEVEGIDVKTAQRILQSNTSAFAESQMRLLKEHEARLVSFWDDEYPALLKHIYDPPAFFFIKGHVSPEDKIAIAVVGSRQPTDYGTLTTRKLTKALSAGGFTIVSGLAYGIDTVAHQTALRSGGRTFAVLGSGLDKLYPTQNKKLADKITQNGAVISEFMFGTGPDRTNFPKRNRIIAGLSRGVLVVEAGERSGALITAAMALEQNREVFAVPGNINSPQSVGSNSLIAQGAKLVQTAADVLVEFASELMSDQSGKVTTPAIHMSEGEKSIFNLLSHEPKHIDTIVQSANQTPGHTLSLLLSLELKGVVSQLTGKMFVRL